MRTENERKEKEKEEKERKKQERARLAEEKKKKAEEKKKKIQERARLAEEKKKKMQERKEANKKKREEKQLKGQKAKNKNVTKKKKNKRFTIDKLLEQTSYTCRSCKAQYVEDHPCEWVECDYCDAWFHVKCTSLPVLDELHENVDFTCHFCVDKGYPSHTDY